MNQALNARDNRVEPQHFVHYDAIASVLLIVAALLTLIVGAAQVRAVNAEVVAQARAATAVAQQQR